MAITLDTRNLTIPKNGLILLLDAGNTSSYPGTGTVWYDISGNGNNFNIVAAAYQSASPQYMSFAGSYGLAKRTTDLQLTNATSGDITYIVWTRVLNSSTDWRTLTRALSSGGDHHVIIQTGAWLIGMYDNTNGSGFNSSGFSQQSLPSYGTTNWDMLVWRFSNSSPYYNFSYNDTPGTIRGSNTSINSAIKQGICSIGGYNGGSTDPNTSNSQYWGDIGMFAIYNRYLTDAEVLQCYNAGAPRFKGAAQQYESFVTFNDGTTQATSYNNLVEKGKLLSTSLYSTSGTYTWTKPNGCTKVLVKVVGAGGGGASYCESGGAGGYSEKIIDVTSVSTVTVTVGGGGAAVTYYAAGGNGGTTSFGAYCSATGGYGCNQNASHTGGHGGVGSGGNVNMLGGTGTGHGNTGGREAVGTGGTTYWGGGRRASHSTNAVTGATAPGAGGVGGAMQSYVGSNGADGAVAVYAYS